MSLPIKTRRWIMLSFFLTFFVIAPILVLYASGYRYDFKRGQLLQTGTLFLETTAAADADIYINDILYQERLNKKIFIYNLLPGTYRIRLIKNGFYPWEKEVLIGSKITTFEKDIVLFKKDTPALVAAGAFTHLTASADFSALAYVATVGTNSEIRVTHLDADRTDTLYSLPLNEPIEDLYWLPSSKGLVLRSNKHLIYLSTREPFSSVVLAAPAPQVLAAPDRSDVVYGLAADGIVAYQIPSGKKNTVVSARITSPSLLIQRGIIYYAVNMGVVSDIYGYSPLTKTSARYATVPGTTLLFRDSGGTQLAVSDIQKGSTYIISIVEPLLTGPVPKPEINQVPGTNFYWDAAGSSGIATDFGEVHYFDGSVERFVTRYGSAVVFARILEDGKHVLLALPDHITIFALQDQEQRLAPLDIVTGDSIASVSLNKKGTELYFNGSINKQRGIYSIKLH